MNLQGFDANEVEPKTDWSPIPAGDYEVMIIDSQEKDNSSGSGSFLELTLEVVVGDHQGERVFDRLNLKNPNEKAVKIAQATLSSICRSVGVMRPSDSSELHNKVMQARIEIEERKDKPGSFSNRVKNYSAVGSEPKKETPKQATTTASAKPPWKK